MEIDSHRRSDAQPPTTTGLLARAAAAGASDLHLLPDSPAIIRVDGGLRPLDGPPVSAADLEFLCLDLLDAGQRAMLESCGAVDIAVALADAPRARINVLRRQRQLALCFRLMPESIPDLSHLALPPAVAGWIDLDTGLALVTGGTGSGKSTTLAALVRQLLRRRPVHVLTIEDPIEHVHEHGIGLVTQRELGADVPSFREALRQALRQDPDVILLGEMRDAETIRAALTLAETGHLVFSTLHSPTTSLALRRIVDAFDAAEQSSVRAQLADVLQAVLSQVLLPRHVGGGRVAACELLVATAGVRALIREAKLHQIQSQIQAGQNVTGMQTLAQSVERLLRAGTIDAATAASFVTPTSGEPSLRGTSR